MGLSSLKKLNDEDALFCADCVAEGYRGKRIAFTMNNIRTDLAKIL
ncbi:MAG: hypothetical protein K6E76_07310 [Patescibacteria group bacterium]|nr:hypothetical protein [Patescibacteria group bacterium]